MLRVVTSEDTKPDVYHLARTSGSLYTVASCVFRNFETHTKSFRSELDFIRQGGKFDAFGNKSVENRQVDGVAFAVPTFDGSDGSGSGFYSSYPHIIFRQTPAVYLERRWNQVANFGDQAMAVSSKKNRLTVVGHALLGYKGTEWLGTLWVEARKSSPSNPQGGCYAHCSLFGTLPDSETETILALAKSYSRTIDWTSNDTILQSAASLKTVWDILADILRVAYLRYISTHAIAKGTPLSVTNWSSGAVDLDAFGRIAVRGAKILRQVTFPSDQASMQARETIESLNDFTSNLLAYAADFKKAGDTIRSLLKLAADYRNPKAWAAAWLSGRYGDRLAVSDTKELLQAISRSVTSRVLYAQGRSRAHTTRRIISGGESYDVDLDRLTVLYAKNDSYDGVATAISTLMRWDAWPTLENTWDLIPLSFLVDWVLPIGELLSQIDAAVEAPYIVPISQYQGLEKSVTIPANLPHVMGSVTVRYYTRGPHDILGEVKPFDFPAQLPSFSVVHMADAAALLVQTRF